MKVIVIVIDGMRSDSISSIETAQKIINKSAYKLNAQTVYPSVTLPCHMSLFHSVTPERHGITTNIYMPQVRPVNGICEILKIFGKQSAMFYSWEDIRDITRPNSLTRSSFYAGKKIGYKLAGELLTDELIAYLRTFETDFTFFHMGYTDNDGHKFGWMSDEYMQAMNCCWNNIDKVMNELGDEYTYIILSDHGGHDRTHGSDMPEDMTIPVIINGKDIEIGEINEDVSIIDIAPTVAKLLGVIPDSEWEGKSLI